MAFPFGLFSSSIFNVSALYQGLNLMVKCSKFNLLSCLLFFLTYYLTKFKSGSRHTLPEQPTNSFLLNCGGLVRYNNVGEFYFVELVGKIL
jgi:hypothetical protein